MQKLIINVFPGAINLPLWAGAAHGMFARRGIETELVMTPNSVEQLTGLAAGKFDIAMTAIDNIVAYREKQGEVRAEGDTDFFAFMGPTTRSCASWCNPTFRASRICAERF